MKTKATCCTRSRVLSHQQRGNCRWGLRGEAEGDGERGPETEAPFDLLGRFHGNIKVDGIGDAFPLELHPTPTGPRAREDECEIHLGSAVRDERLLMDEMDQIVARRQHVPSCTKVSSQAVARGQVELHVGLTTGKGSGGAVTRLTRMSCASLVE